MNPATPKFNLQHDLEAAVLFHLPSSSPGITASHIQLPTARDELQPLHGKDLHGSLRGIVEAAGTADGADD
jgi:hypothetical protein